MALVSFVAVGTSTSLCNSLNLKYPLWPTAYQIYVNDIQALY